MVIDLQHLNHGSDFDVVAAHHNNMCIILVVLYTYLEYCMVDTA